MNVFRSKKKDKHLKEPVDDGGRASHEDLVPALKQMKTFRRKKTKDVEQPKVELDLANALPASDDFRTSLLMTGLSARFSMLREQDDPNSKLGKASDDSVLFPRRQSRMNNFNFSPMGLSDIAEVGSISDSKRPFASNDHERNGSSYSIDDSEGSIMNRGKPAEGNNLFGGRQKVYKIPASSYSSSALGSQDASGQPKAVSGRAVYEDDLIVSPFQKLKQKEREMEEKEKERQEQLLASGPVPGATSRSDSPPLPGYNRNRETSSTTSSGPNDARSSTAATSFISQRTPSVNGHSAPSTPAIPSQSASNGVERSTTKAKRLYENGLDQHLHTQQSSAANRIDNLSRQGRGLGVRSPSPSPASPEAPKFSIPQNSSQPKATVNGSHSVAGGFDFGVKSPSRGPASPTKASPITSPLVKPVASPTITEEDDSSTLLIQSNALPDSDEPKTRPVQQYDEAKYQERQQQMQGARAVQPLRKPSPPRNAPIAFNAAASANRSRSASAAQRDFTPRERIYAPPTGPSSNIQPVGPPFDPSRPNMLRKNDYRQQAGVAEPIKPRVPVWEQSAHGQVPRPVQRFDERPSMDRPSMDRSPMDRPSMDRQRQMLGSRDGQPPRRNPPPNHFPPAMSNNGMAPRSRADSHSAYSKNMNGTRSRSNSSAQREFMPRERTSPAQNMPPLDTQPTLPVLEKPPSRPITPKEPVAPAVVPESPKQKMSAWEQASAYDEFEADIPASLKTSRWTPPEHPALREKKPERSPVLPLQPPPPAQVQALKTHTPIETAIKEEVEPANDSPTLPPRSALRGLVRQRLRSDSDDSSDDDESVRTSVSKPHANPWDGNDWDDGNIDAVQPTPLKIGNQMRSNGPPSVSRTQTSQANSRAVSTVSDTPSWEKELTRQHTREKSTESQKERDDFANELAARRKRVQENLRSFAESESRSQSPVRHAALDDSSEAAFAKTNRLNFLKSKTSRSSLVVREEPAPSAGAINNKGMKMLGINGIMNGSSTTVNSHRVDENLWKREEEEMMRGIPKKSPVPPASEFRQTRRDAQRERERHMMARHQQVGQVGGPEYNSHPDDRSRRHQMDQPLPLRQAEYGRPRNGTRTRSPSREAPPVTYRGYQQTPGGMF